MKRGTENPVGKPVPVTPSAASFLYSSGGWLEEVLALSLEDLHERSVGEDEPHLAGHGRIDERHLPGARVDGGVHDLAVTVLQNDLGHDALLSFETTSRWCGRDYIYYNILFIFLQDC